MTSEDGGPAFPIPNATDMEGYVYAAEARGMSLRDWFAAQVFPACISRAKGLETLDATGLKRALTHIAEASYLAADAMLAARKTGAAE